jgi:hypothetical protein
MTLATIFASVFGAAFAILYLAQSYWDKSRALAGAELLEPLGSRVKKRAVQVATVVVAVVWNALVLGTFGWGVWWCVHHIHPSHSPSPIDCWLGDDCDERR